jgi:hypothetical protein
MPTGDGSRSRTLMAENLIERLERILEQDVTDARAREVARRAAHHELAQYGRSAPLAEHDIANLLQEALEEGPADERLSQVVFALGLLKGSLNSPRGK